MARQKEYHVKVEMLRLADQLSTLIEMYKKVEPKMSLAAAQEQRMLITLGHEIEKGKDIGEATGEAILQLAHQRKIEAAMRARKRPLPIDVAFSKVEGKANGGRSAEDE